MRHHDPGIALVDARPDDPERALARWAVLGEIGDLAAPVLMAGLAAAGLDVQHPLERLRIRQALPDQP